MEASSALQDSGHSLPLGGYYTPMDEYPCVRPRGPQLGLATAATASLLAATVCLTLAPHMGFSWPPPLMQSVTHHLIRSPITVRQESGGSHAQRPLRRRREEIAFVPLLAAIAFVHNPVEFLLKQLQPLLLPELGAPGRLEEELDELLAVLSVPYP